MITAIDISCANCGETYPLDRVPYCCPNCGGVYDIRIPLPFNPEQIDSSQPGIWRYRHTFGVPGDIEPVSLGEGNTPLIWADAFGRKVAFKCEFLNPSGSFKDRGSTVIATWLRAHGVIEAVEDSSGNAGASIAGYAARAGIKARIFVPVSASGSKRRQIEAYGAELVTIPGSRTDVTEAARRVADGGVAYASHAFLPFILPGYATAAYEIFDQLGKMPGAVVVPAGQGGLLLGLKRGFDALRVANNSTIIPRMIGVQARACAPLCAKFASGGSEIDRIADNPTLAEGVRVRYPLREEAVLDAIADSHGFMYAVDEQEILQAYQMLAHLGFYVEPTSAIVWAALSHFVDELPDPVVVILSGSGLKYG